MSALSTPDARISARAPAMLRPWVTVRDLSSGTVSTPLVSLGSYEGRDARPCGRGYARRPGSGRLVRMTEPVCRRRDRLAGGARPYVRVGQIALEGGGHQRDQVLGGRRRDRLHLHHVPQ